MYIMLLKAHDCILRNIGTIICILRNRTNIVKYELRITNKGGLEGSLINKGCWGVEMGVQIRDD